MAHRFRIFYISPNILEDFRVFHNEPFKPSPGGNKVEGLVRALILSGFRAWAISAPIVSKAKNNSYGSLVVANKECRSFYFPSYRNRWINRFSSLISYAKFCAFTVRKDDKVIFYNFYFDYLLAALILRIRGIPGILDVEDDVRKSSWNYRELINRFSFLILLSLCSKKLLVASRAIEKRFSDRETLINYPAAQTFSVNHPDDSVYKILFSGAKTVEWGVDLFSDCLRSLAKIECLRSRKMHFHVTGFGDFSGIQKVVKEFDLSFLVSLHQDAPTEIYNEIVSSCVIALELRLPNSEGANTTFPSKIVELSSRGLLIVTTGTGDVPHILGDDAFYLSEPTGFTLANSLISIVNEFNSWKQVAVRGKKRIDSLHSPQNVGKRLGLFLA